MWRGINVIRAYNPKPANPNTAGQKLARASLAHLTNIWKHMPSDISAAWNDFAKGLPRSGFNCFMKKNAADQQTDTWLQMTPSNPGIMPIENFRLIGSAVTSLHFAWDLADADASALMRIKCFLDVQPLSMAGVAEADAVVVKEYNGTHSAQDLSIHVSVLESATDYICGGAVRDATLAELAISAMAKGTTT